MKQNDTLVGSYLDSETDRVKIEHEMYKFVYCEYVYIFV